jgi:hypothetical protein
LSSKVVIFVPKFKGKQDIKQIRDYSIEDVYNGKEFYIQFQVVRYGSVLDGEVQRGPLPLAERDALRLHLLRPDPRLELLGTVFRLELDEVLVRLGRPGIVAVVSLAAGGGLGPLLLPVKFPWDLPANGTRMCHNAHVALGIFPLPWSATRQTLGCLLPQLLAVQTSLEVHRADLPLLFLGLLRQQDVRRKAPQGRRLGQLGQLGRLHLAGGCVDVALLEGGRVDHTLDVVLQVGEGVVFNVP